MRTPTRLLAAGLVLGAVVRAIALPSTGTEDVGVWKIWSFAATRDLTGVYGVGGASGRATAEWQGRTYPVDHPPLAIAELALVGHAYQWVIPSFRDTRLLNCAIKLPGLCAEALFVVAALTWGRRRFGSNAARWTALAFWLNPGIVLDGSVLGYLDAQAAVPAAASLVAAISGPAWLAGALAAIGMLTKPQVLFAFPAMIGALLWRSRSALRALGGAVAGGAATCAVLTLPFVVRGAGIDMIRSLRRLGGHDMLSGNGTNLWWIVGWLLRAKSSAAEQGWWSALTAPVRIVRITRAVALGIPNPRIVGVVVVGCACLWIVWRMRGAQSLGAAAAMAAWSAYAYAICAAQVHENHLYVALPFLAIAAGLNARYRSFFYWVSAIFTANLLLFYGVGPRWPAPINRHWTIIDASVVLAFLNVAVFVWITATIAVALEESPEDS